MSSSPIRPQTVLRVALALATTALPLLAIGIVGMELLTWFRIHRGVEYYYVEEWSLELAGWLLLGGLVGVLPAGWVLFQPRARLRYLWLPTLVSVCMFMYPNMMGYGLVAPDPRHIASYQVQHQLSQVVFELRQAAEQELPWHCASGSTTTLSPYSRAGERLFYQRLCVPADRSMESPLASSAPGTMYIGTNSGEQAVWVMATVLPRDASDTVSWLQGRTGDPVRVFLAMSQAP